MIVAIDGPAASGKSTVARSLAKVLGLVFLDTGAMYRAVTLRVLTLGVDPADGPRCGEVARQVEIRFDDQGRVLINGEPGEPDIRSARVTARVSQVAAHPEVRASIVPCQREIARSQGVVAEGRDTTSAVFPGAQHKFFLVASARERARRRATEMGAPEALEGIQAQIEERDRYDSTREHSPLLQAPDATLVDTDGKSPEAVLAELLERIREPKGPGTRGSP